MLIHVELCHVCLRSVLRPVPGDRSIPEVFSAARCAHLTCTSCAQTWESAETCRVPDCGAPARDAPLRLHLLNFIEAKHRTVRSVFPESSNPAALQQRSYVNVTSASADKLTLVDREFVSRNLRPNNTFVFLNDLLSRMVLDPGTIRADWNAFTRWCDSLGVRFVYRDELAAQLDYHLQELGEFSLSDLKYPAGRFRIEPYFGQFRVQSLGLLSVGERLRRVVRASSAKQVELGFEEMLAAHFDLPPDSQGNMFVSVRTALHINDTGPPLTYLNADWPPPVTPSPPPPSTPQTPTRKSIQRARILSYLSFRRTEAAIRDAARRSHLLRPRDAVFLASSFPGLQELIPLMSLDGLGLSPSQALAACSTMSQLLVLFQAQGTLAGVFRDKPFLMEDHSPTHPSSFFLWVSGCRVWHPPPQHPPGDFAFPDSFPVFGGALTSSPSPS